MSDSHDQHLPSEEPQPAAIACPKCRTRNLSILNRRREVEGRFQIGTLEAAVETNAILLEVQCNTCGHRFTHRQVLPTL